MKKIYKTLAVMFFIFVFTFGFYGYSRATTIITQQQANQLNIFLDSLEVDVSLSFFGFEVEEDFCYDFEKDLSIFDNGEDVEALQTALQEEGFMDDYEKKNGQYIYELDTVSAVKSFTNKYTPVENIVRNSGFLFTASTREKMNDLYGCDVKSDKLGEYEVLEGSFYKEHSSREDVISSAIEFANSLPGLQKKYSQIDFEKKKVALIALGERESGGFGIEITDVEVDEKDEEVVLNYREKTPQPEDVVALAMTYPIKAISVVTHDFDLIINKVNEDEEEKEITLLSPNGGEEWVAGSTNTIKWNSSGLDGDMRILLEKWSSGKPKMPRINNRKEVPVTDQEYSWLIPEDQEPGSHYKVKISSLDGAQIGGVGVKDSSDDYFTIVNEGPEIETR